MSLPRSTMKNLFATLIFCLIIVLQQATAVAQSSPPSVALPAELARILTEYQDAWNKNDPAALAQLFAEDGFVLSNGSPAAHGRAAIKEAYSGPNKRHLSLRAIAFAAEGSVGYIIGGFSDATGVPDRGKFTLTLRRESSGRWLIMSDMDNGNNLPVRPGCPTSYGKKSNGTHNLVEAGFNRFALCAHEALESRAPHFASLRDRDYSSSLSDRRINSTTLLKKNNY
jgi:uncharacterized protein (TIGR02246 family)